jgi:large subunit ribosomal protein L3
MEYIVEKIGMTRTVNVPSVAVTLLKVVDTKVCEVAEDGSALVAYPQSKQGNKAIEGQQKKYALSAEYNNFMKLKKVANTEAGDIDVAALTDGSKLKVTFNTKGRGFSGAVKRHGFAGGRASHGHRMGKRTGSIGMCEWPGRVMPGQKMPGQYGNTQVSVGSEIVSFDSENGILAVKGAVPGPNGAFGKVFVKGVK